ncbi:chemotaxis protein CheB [Lewinella sp. IMCC34183]|uniref:chemotaxis protein CheB n=1 Tax=Lewinella sp. IMCC34183 TaxID=2248762 RepID=UPI000E23DD03|nr:chemotaxis protein CheB [Lewinella sp. IMCC34183]
MSSLSPDYRNVIVVGASAGGVEALVEFVRGVPEDLPAAICIVQHIPAYARSRLDTILQGHTKFEVRRGEDGEALRPGRMYIAPPDHHLLVEGDRVLITRGPRENRFRPAVDTLFRSAAHAYRQRTIGIVLSGALNDGTSGMWTIKRFGGLAIVQDPEEAMFSDMPEGVMKYTEVDYIRRAGDMGPLLDQLCHQRLNTALNGRGVKNRELLEIELSIAKGKNGLEMGILEQGTPSPLTCPECHGALTEFEEGKLVRYRCHTGHAHTAESLLASVTVNVEKSMWEVMRGLEESRLVLEHLADQMDDGDGLVASQYRARAREIQEQAKRVQRLIQSTDLSETQPRRTI